MARQYSRGEIQTINAFEDEVRPQLALSGSVTGDQNAEAIIAQFDNQPITRSALVAVVESLTRNGNLIWKSKALMEYEAACAATGTAQVEQFLRWFNNQHELVTEGDLGLENATNILTEIGPRSFSVETVFAAINRIQNGGSSKFSKRRRPLHFVPSQTRIDPRSHTHRPVENKPSDGRRYVGGRLDHASDPASFPDKSEPPRSLAPPDAWEVIAKKLLGSGRSHGQNEALQREYNRGVNQEVPSWRIVARNMQNLKNEYSRLVPTARF